jgi:predicted ArsR family transcriptional regulator
LAGRIMARAIEATIRTGAPVADALHDSATAEGRRLGEAAQARLAEDASPTASIKAIGDVLAEHGYEPRSSTKVITLANCPFHALAREHQELVCAMNLELITALLGTCKGSGVQAQFEPEPGRCCVTLGYPG